MAKEIQRIKICPECGVDNPSVYWHCWICSCDLRGQQEIILATEVLDEPEAPPIPNWPPTWTEPARRSLMPVIWLVALTTVVGIGLSLQEWGMSIPYVVVVTPIIAGLLLIEQNRRSKRTKATLLDSLISVILSAFMIVALLIMALIGAVVALFLLCLYVLRF